MRILPNNKLTLTSSASNISYRDLSILSDVAKILCSVLTKSTDRHGYLQYKSIRPMQINKCIVYSEFMRYNRICKQKITFGHHASNIFQHYLMKVYHFKLINDELKKVSLKCRNHVMKYSNITDTNNIPDIHHFIQQFGFLSKTFKIYVDIAVITST